MGTLTAPDQPSAMATDPIRGMSVDEETAAHSLCDAGIKYFFCSSDCLNQFAARIESLARLRRGADDGHARI